MNSLTPIENRKSKIENHYTDSPTLHPNLILGSLQLIFWLFIHHAAWRNYINYVDPSLRPNFTLAQLGQAQWRNQSLRRLLIQGFLIVPAILGLLVLIDSWLISTSDSVKVMPTIPAGIALALASILVGSLAIGAVVSVAAGIAFSATSGLIGLIGSGLIQNLSNFGEFTAEAVLLAIWVGLLGYVAGNIAEEASASSLLKQIGSVLIGIMISTLLLSLVLQITKLIGSQTESGPAYILSVGLIFTLIVSAVFGVAIRWRTNSWRRGLAGGITALLVVGLGGGIMLSAAAGAAEKETTFLALIGAAMGIAIGFLFCALFAVPYLLAERIAGPWAGAVAGILGSIGVYIAFTIYLGGYTLSPILPLSVGVMVLSLSIGWWRPVLLYPFLAIWNLLLWRADQRRFEHAQRRFEQVQRCFEPTGSTQRPSFLRWHSAFWDEAQRLPLAGLDEHLVLVAGYNPAEGRAALEYLATSRQRKMAQAAQVELDARALESCAEVSAIGQMQRRLQVGELAGPSSALLRSFSRISQDVEAALQQESAYNQRLALSAVEDRLDGQLRELTRSSEPYAVRFQPIAAQWRQTVAEHVRALGETVEQRQEIDSPYIIGVPLTEQQEIFVGRADISARIEQLLLDRRQPPLLLYGQRRMGKTSLLNNLGRLLPSRIVPLFVDLQGPASRASDHAGFLYNIARSMVDSARQQRSLALPTLSRDELADDPFTCFDEWLDQLEQVLETAEQRTALLTFDEFETLAAPITEGRFSETAVLGMFRNLIQHRPRFKLMLTGSHTLDEFQTWASYLINVQTLHIGYLSEAEARQLIERPVQEFALRYRPEASQRIIALTRGHPALLQLLCAEVVALKNEQPPDQRRQADLADVEAAIPEALAHGSFFFADIQRNQVDETGLSILRFLARQGEGQIVGRDILADQIDQAEQIDETLAQLIRRELIEPVDDGYRFQVELIRRWFAD